MYRYKLEPYKGIKSRYRCPNCGKPKKFSRYIDTQTGDQLPPEYGRCERLNNCGYWLSPYKNGYAKNKVFNGKVAQKSAKILKSSSLTKDQKISLIPDDSFIKSQNHYERNFFVQYLLTVFDTGTVDQLIQNYFLGTSSHWFGSTIFWQVDKQGRIRTGKIMLYNSYTGGRIKEPFNHINWMHIVLKPEKFELEQCLFGEHLLTLHPSKPVAIVESEKTAVIASVYLPEFLWLATGGESNLSAKKCEPLKGRRVFLFPDLGSYHDWTNEVGNLSEIGILVVVVELLEKLANEQEKQKGLDLADYLVQYTLEEFQGGEGAGFL